MDVEKIIFNMYKDTELGTVKDFKSKLMKKFKGINWYELYARITNYQIKKYGTSLRYKVFVDGEFKHRAKINAQGRKYDKTRRNR